MKRYFLIAIIIYTSFISIQQTKNFTASVTPQLVFVILFGLIVLLLIGIGQSDGR